MAEASAATQLVSTNFKLSWRGTQPCAVVSNVVVGIAIGEPLWGHDACDGCAQNDTGTTCGRCHRS
eukprot:1762056-Pyramimonas_sp.AAC.1